MHWPYTRDFLDSFMAAQIGAALMMTAVLLYWPLVRAARTLLLPGVWLSAIATLVAPSLENLGFEPRAEVHGRHGRQARSGHGEGAPALDRSVARAELGDHWLTSRSVWRRSRSLACAIYFIGEGCRMVRRLLFPFRPNSRLR